MAQSSRAGSKPDELRFRRRDAAQRNNRALRSLCSRRPGRAGVLPFAPAEPDRGSGAALKLIEVTYHGVTRVMEPYSWSLSGAVTVLLRSTSTRGTVVVVCGRGQVSRRCLHYDVQALEVTDQTFEPRFRSPCPRQGTVPRVAPSSAGAARELPRVMRPHAARGHNWPHVRGPVPDLQQALDEVRTLTRLNSHRNPWGSPCAGRVGSSYRSDERGS